METGLFDSFGDILKAYRKRRKLTQSKLAALLKIHPNTVGAWERGEYLPETKEIVLELARLLQLDEQETRRLLEASLSALTPYWYVPYQRNPFFTGREALLDTLHTLLHTNPRRPASYALSGLGGSGKTQVAIEYVYRTFQEYTAVFWLDAATTSTLLGSFYALAEALQVPGFQHFEPQKIVTVVQRWLNMHRDWLLVVDNVADIETLRSYLPAARSGSLLFTTRRQDLDTLATCLPVEGMTEEEGIHFLLKRAGLPRTPDLEATARTLVREMDGLPLALDQAGAYISTQQIQRRIANHQTDDSLRDYLHRLRQQPIPLLQNRGDYSDHPLSVVSTFTLSFLALKQTYPAAAKLLIFCCFLAPEPVPERLFTRGMTTPTIQAIGENPLEFNRALQALQAYSLLHRHPEHETLHMHRLVQVVLKASFSETERFQWEERVLACLCALLPDSSNPDAAWPLLPHAFYAVTHYRHDSEHYITLATRAAAYLTTMARYEAAEKLYRRVMQLQHPPTLSTLLGFAELRSQQHHYDEAEALYRQALQQDEDHQLALSGLAALLSSQGRHQEAEQLLLRSLSPHRQEQAFSPELLNNLAQLYYQQGRYEEAETVSLRSLYMLEQRQGRESLALVTPLKLLAQLATHAREYTKAEFLYHRIRTLYEKHQETKHPEYLSACVALIELALLQGQQAHERYKQLLSSIEAFTPEIQETLAHLEQLFRQSDA
ncbi:Tfp pilus assembly protein PilF [Thermosporothrix hazakensis]|jgi:tetratricopeptide (TPR) repeat protein|uniref:Tfp pilus assembly protein PilF n=1 Tax=Thermosporothrix hazakensis TaxID=644383 RepID=A0A326U898_THEHA|nr:tetratricopeptide repeat protein [Thermosporothrix hazakensis]PZW29519.1 Tfp pilus assembly protein PilF [Thermosporothrix hazakensis]GCE45766.1 hypothetical protein KTH_06350 [Thermosporothrix hazakensis]